MATTTPNFGWPVPTSTDLVKDGATAIESLGDSIDASLLDLKGGTTGQVLSKNSNTDMDFTWTAIDPLVILDAKGDLITATAADTPARLAVGTNGQVLTADSTAGTGLAWATPTSGSFTSLASGSITNGLSLTSISGSYTDLYLVINNCAPTVTDQIGIRINNDATAANYVQIAMRNITGGTGTALAASTWAFVDITGNSSVKQTTSGNSYVVYFPNYAGTTNWKIATSNGGHNNNLDTFTTAEANVIYRSTSAITRLDFKTAGSDWANQGTYTLYGVK
jgi:hypothetical protein